MTDSQRGGASFWSSDGPLASLACAGLLVIASGRLAYALVAGIGLVFVYLCSILSQRLGNRLVSDRIRGAVAVVLSSLFAALFLLILSLSSPLLAQESSFFILLTPIVYIASGITDRCVRDDIYDTVGRATIESASILALLVAFALIREPIGHGSLSLPGRDGVALVFRADTTSFFPVGAVSSSIGGLILTAYAVFAFRTLRARVMEAGIEKEDA